MLYENNHRDTEELRKNSVFIIFNFSVSPCLISFYFYKRKSRIVNLIYSQTVHNEQSFLDLAVQMILAVRCNILL